MYSDSLCHHGLKGQRWYYHKFGRWQDQAMYAMGKSDPEKQAKRGSEDALSDYRLQMIDRGSLPETIGWALRSSVVPTALAGPLASNSLNVVRNINKIEGYNRRTGDNLSLISIGSNNRRILNASREFDATLEESTVKRLGLSKEYVDAYSKTMNELLSSKRNSSALDRLNKRNQELAKIQNEKRLRGEPYSEFQKALDRVGRLTITTTGASLLTSLAFRRYSPSGANSVLDGALSDIKAISARRRMASLPKDAATGLPIKSGTSSIAKDMAAVNPGYHGTISWMKGSHTNCMDSTVAYDLRRRGYDVTAAYSRGHPFSTIGDLYKGSKTNYFYGDGAKTGRITSAMTKTILESIKNQGDGARGNICLEWFGKGGHAISYEVQNGKVMLLNPQTNKVIGNATSYIGQAIRAEVTRTDNCQLNLEVLKDFIG